MGQYEDWWYLIEDAGSFHVEHEWDHVRVRGLERSEGTEKLSVEEAILAGPSPVKDKLIERFGP